MRRILRGIYGLYAWAVLLICVVLTTTLLIFVPGLGSRRRIARFSARLLFRACGIGLKISGDVAVIEKSCVVVSNHASYLDGIILTAALPPHFSFLVKREMKSVPVASLLLRRLGTEFVERFDFRRGATDARRIIRTAGGGQGLAAFPEGTFRQEPGLGRFYSGAFSAAVRSGMPVVPITVLGSRHILPANQMLPVPGNLHLIVHPAIPTKKSAVDRDAVFRVRDLARERILSALGEVNLDFRLPATPTDAQQNALDL